MLRLVCVLLLLPLLSKVYAQPIITGSTQDTTHQPLAYCSVALVDERGNIVKGTISGADGGFSVVAQHAGNYTVKVRMIGFEAYTTPVFYADSLVGKHIGIITLRKSAADLKDVVVKSARPLVEFKNGRTILNIENDVLANGNTVLEVLKRMPGITIDAQNNVLVEGRAGVTVMLDGRQQQMPLPQVLDMLANTAADGVASVELIKNPSAKYDAAGTAGIINIVSRKVRVHGLSGSVMASGGQGKQAAGGSAVTLNYKTNKLTFFSNANYMNRVLLNDMTVNRTLNAPQGDLTVNSAGRSVSFVSVLNAKAGMEYQPGERTTLGFEVGTRPNTTNEYVHIASAVNGSAGPVYNMLQASAYNPEQFNSPSAAVYMLHILDSMGSQVKLTADYTRFIDEFTGNSHNYFYNGGQAQPMLAYKNHIALNYNVATQKVDITKVLNGKTTLEIGEKASFVQNDNNSELQRNSPGTEAFYTDAAFVNRFRYKEQVIAGYANVARALKKGMLQAGVRAEHTRIDAVNQANGYSFKQQYLNFFPSLGLEYALSPKYALQVAYSYRIDRPLYTQLNPLKAFTDAMNISSGNAALRPMYTNKITAELNAGEHLHLSASYNNAWNSIYNYSFTRADGSGINVDTCINLAHSTQVVVGAYLQWQPRKWYMLQVSVNGMYGNRNGVIEGVPVDNSTWAAMGSANNVFVLPHNYRLQVNVAYTSGYQDGVQHYAARGNGDIALQKRLLNNKLNINLGVYDVLYTDYSPFTTSLPGLSYYSRMRPDSRRVRLTINYRFGNMKIDRRLNEQTDAASRINKGN